MPIHVAISRLAGCKLRYSVLCYIRMCMQFIWIANKDVASSEVQLKG